jgi:broad specificity phosphatase PhoE
MNTHVKSRTLYFTRHGESQYNLQHLIGGDSLLSDRGLVYRDKLKEYFDRFDLSHAHALVMRIVAAWARVTSKFGAAASSGHCKQQSASRRFGLVRL